MIGIVLERLKWDSQHFGLEIGRIQFDHTATDDLAAALAEARDAGLQLVYGFSSAPVELPDELMCEFGAVRVDDRITYRRPLTSSEPRPAEISGVRIAEYPVGAASESLMEMGLLAGARSRFRMDRRIPQRLCDELFRIWVDRSARREIAEAVLVATDDFGQLLGFTTLARRETTGVGSLIAVQEAARGRGIGRRLVEAGQEWMGFHGAIEATRVTQAGNTGARLLYLRMGYAEANVECVYHFWLQPELHGNRSPERSRD